MSISTVLYDHPGPRARTRYWIYSAIFLAFLGLLVWWVVSLLARKGQLDAAKWRPFLQWSTWQTYLLPGLAKTLEAAAISVVIAVPIGMAFGVARMSQHRWLRWSAGVIVEFFRAIPVIVLMLFAFLLYFTVMGNSNPLAGVVIGLVLYNGSVLAEVFRAGIRALPTGQTEAGLAIGLRRGQIMGSILLPQAFTSMLPAIISQLVVVVKDTALGGIFLGFTELRRAAGTAASALKNIVPMYIVIALMYVLLNLIMTYLASATEQRLLRRGGKATVAGLTGPADMHATKLSAVIAEAPGVTDTDKPDDLVR